MVCAALHRLFSAVYQVVGPEIILNKLIDKIVILASALHDPNNKSPFAKAVFKPISEMAHPVVHDNTDLKKMTEGFYATSKLCNVLFAYELDRRINFGAGSHKTVVNSINPGFVPATNLGRTYKRGENLKRIAMEFFFKLIGIAQTPEVAARNIVKLIDKVSTSGKYYDSDKQIVSSIDSYDLEKARLLWEGSESIVGLKFT